MPRGRLAQDGSFFAVGSDGGLSGGGKAASGVSPELIRKLAEMLSMTKGGDSLGGDSEDSEPDPNEDAGTFKLTEDGETKEFTPPEGTDTSSGEMDWGPDHEPYFDSLAQDSDAAPSSGRKFQVDVGDGDVFPADESGDVEGPSIGEGSIESQPSEDGKFGMGVMPGSEVGPSPAGPPKSPEEIIQAIIQILTSGDEEGGSLAGSLAGKFGELDDLPEGA